MIIKPVIFYFIQITNVTDPLTAQSTAPLRVEVLEAPAGTYTYNIYNDNTNAVLQTGAHTPPQTVITGFAGAFDIEINGDLSGLAPNSPETFTINDAFGLGNGTNAFAMADTKDQGLINNGRETFNQSLAISTAKVGTDAKSAELVADTADALYTQSYNRNQEVKGVNLDEEAANLLRFQQAYQASSRIVSVASEIFDTLLAAAR